MGQHDVPRREARRKLFDNVLKGVVVRDKNLHVIAHLGELYRSTDEVRHRSRGPTPHEYMESFSAKDVPHAASNYSEADYTNIFSCSTGHGSAPSRGGDSAQNQPEVQTRGEAILKLSNF